MKIIDFLRCHFSRWRSEYKEEYHTGSKVASGAFAIGLVLLGLFVIRLLIIKFHWLGVAYVLGVPIALVILWFIAWRLGRKID